MTDSNKKPAGQAKQSPAGLSQLSTANTEKIRLYCQKILRPSESKQELSQQEPFADAADISIFRQAVENGLRILPVRYHATYVQVLKLAVDQAEASIKASRFGREKRRNQVVKQLIEVFQALAAPIMQLTSSKQEGELKAYLALASNIYQRFVGDEQVRKLNKGSGKWPELDPLGYFLNNGSGPFTLPPSPELPVSIIAKPANLAACIPLWVLDGHEVGGHGIHSTVQGFDQEIADVVEKAIRQAVSGGAFALSGAKLSKLATSLLSADAASPENFLSRLLRSFSLELAADIAGVLNFGPMFGNGLMLYLSAESQTGKLSNLGRLVARDRIDAHPPDRLRALVTLSAISKLGLTNQKAIDGELAQRYQALSENSATILSFRDETDTYTVNWPLSDFQPLVEVLSTALLDSKLKCLGNRSLKQVLTWMDRDEEETLKLSQTIVKARFRLQEGDFEPRHIVSASLIALEQATRKSDFGTIAALIQTNATAMLKDFYLQQCLLCAVPTYSKTRRNENSLSALTQLSDIAARIKRLQQDNQSY